MVQLPQKKKDEPNIRKTAQMLKQKFLEGAGDLVDQYIGAAMGTAELTSNNAGAREEVWDVLKKLILQSSDKLEIDIKSAEDVIDAVSKGKCTFEEGEKLLSLYKKVKEIDTMGSIGAGVGGLTINILNANTEEVIPAGKVVKGTAVNSTQIPTVRVLP